MDGRALLGSADLPLSSQKCRSHLGFSLGCGNASNRLSRWRLSSGISSMVSSGPLYPRFHRRDAQRGSLADVLRQHSAAGPPGLPHGRGVWRDGPCQPQPAVVAGNSPVYGPGWEFPLVVAQGVAGKPGLFLPGRTVYFCPFQPGVQQDDALRLRQGLGERARGQESGPAGGAAGPRRLLPGKYPSRRNQRGQERPRRPFGTAGPGGRGGHPGGHPH